VDSYLLELRLSGSAKKYAKEQIFEISQIFGVKGATAHRVVPHVSMVGSFETNFEKRAIVDIATICKKHDLMSFKFVGFTSFGSWLFGKRVLAINIEASPELKQLHSDLVKVLSEYCQLGGYDKKKWNPHATLAFKDIDNKFTEIKNYLEKQDCPQIKHYVLRLTLLKNAKILYEYDFFLKRGLTREEALDKRIKQMTLAALKDRLFISRVFCK
jgi:2'-5' RNA ligase